MMVDQAVKRRGGRRRAQLEAPARRTADYHNLRNTLPHAEIFSTDQVEDIHDAALRVLEELGIRVLHDEARSQFAAAGAKVSDDDQMVFIDRGLVAEALGSAPSSFYVRAPSTVRDMFVGENSLSFGPGAGCPNITDLDRGRRPGSFSDFIETVKLQQSFDIIPKLGPCVEPQDLPVATRHLDVMEAQLRLSDKLTFIYSRGTGQVVDSFEMLRIAAGLTREEFCAEPRGTTVINTNSPRQIDIPMAQGIMDFAAWGQVVVITPFCLAGAMAPITIPGALTLSHAEALAGITLAQIVRPGAPVVYGAFSSNVDMKSGAPVFGTPEHIKTNYGAGQLARHVGLPWRSAAGTAANAPDVQAANENQSALWGALLAGANLIYHAAGWLEGGLTFSMEKFVTDIEVLQTVAESMQPVSAGADDIGFDAIAEVAPGGHFFAATQTMAHYKTAFYEPIISDWSNFGQWSENGSISQTERANAHWKRLLADFEPPNTDPARMDEIADYVARRKSEGGAPPVN